VEEGRGGATEVGSRVVPLVLEELEDRAMAQQRARLCSDYGEQERRDREKRKQGNEGLGPFPFCERGQRAQRGWRGVEPSEHRRATRRMGPCLVGHDIALSIQIQKFQIALPETLP
jgi:hypothetical protein